MHCARTSIRSTRAPPRSSMSHPTRITRPIAGAIAVIALALSASSCAILVPPEPRSGGDGIRAAAEEAKKKPEDQTPLVAGHRDCSDCDVAGTVVAGIGEPP